MKNYGLISSIVMWVLILISVIFLIIVMVTGGTGSFVSFGMNLTWITFALVIITAIVSMIVNPQTIKGTLIGIAAVVIVFGVAYGLADGSTTKCMT